MGQFEPMHIAKQANGCDLAFKQTVCSIKNTPYATSSCALATCPSLTDLIPRGRARRVRASTSLVGTRAAPSLQQRRSAFDVAQSCWRGQLSFDIGFEHWVCFPSRHASWLHRKLHANLHGYSPHAVRRLRRLV